MRDAVSRHRGGVLSTESFREEIEEQTPVSHGDMSLKAGAVSFADGLSALHKFPALKEMEKMAIAEALRRADGNQTIAAQLLGISRQALNSRLARARKSTTDV